MVGAVVPEAELVGLEADRAAEQLVTEADPVDGLATDDRPDRLDDVVERRRVARPVGEEDRVGVAVEQLLGARGAGMQRQLGAAAPEVADDRGLDAGIDHRDPNWVPPTRGVGRIPGRPDKAAVQIDRSRRSHLACQVASAHRRLGVDQRTRLGLGDPRREDTAAHRALVADVLDQRPRVEVGDRRDAAVAQPRQPAELGSRGVVAIDARPHDRRACVDAIGLHRRLGDAVVADLRKGEGDQLAQVAGIGHRLLVARHRGREHDLADGVGVGAAGEPVEPGAVLEQHVCGRL